MKNAVKLKKDGSYSMIGLSKNAKESLLFRRSYLPSDDYIIAYYSVEMNDVYFADESYMTNDKKANII